MLAVAAGTAGNCEDEGRATAAAISSGRRCVDSHANDVGGLARGFAGDLGMGRAPA